MKGNELLPLYTPLDVILPEGRWNLAGLGRVVWFPIFFRGNCITPLKIQKLMRILIAETSTRLNKTKLKNFSNRLRSRLFRCFGGGNLTRELWTATVCFNTPGNSPTFLLFHCIGTNLGSLRRIWSVNLHLTQSISSYCRDISMSRSNRKIKLIVTFLS